MLRQRRSQSPEVDMVVYPNKLMTRILRSLWNTCPVSAYSSSLGTT